MTDLIKVVDPDKQYEPDGDVLWGAAADWSAPRNDEPPDSMRVCGLQLNALDGHEHETDIIFFDTVHPNPFRALRYMGIDRKWFDGVRHKDPYTEQDVYGVVPVAVLTDDPEKYRKSLTGNIPFVDLALDSDFCKGQRSEDEHFVLSDIKRLFLGSGYTYGCSIFDGGGHLESAKLKLSNGDWLYVWFWEWYNK